MQFIYDIFKYVLSLFNGLFKKSSIENNISTDININDIIVYENLPNNMHDKFEKSKSYREFSVDNFDYNTFIIEYEKHETEFVAINQNKKLKIALDLYFKEAVICKKTYFVFNGDLLLLEIINERANNEIINVFSLDKFDISSDNKILLNL